MPIARKGRESYNALIAATYRKCISINLVY